MLHYYILAFKKYFDFKGIATRREYWYFVVANTIVGMLLGFADTTTGTQLISSTYSLAAFIPTLAVMARRLHDAGHSGWIILPWCGLIALIEIPIYLNWELPPAVILLATLMVLIMSVVMLIWLCQKTKTENNKYRS